MNFANFVMTTHTGMAEAGGTEGGREGGREAVIQRKTFACSVFLIDGILISTSAVPHCERSFTKLQALVYDLLPSTTAVFSYAIGSRKLSANEQFFVGAQTVVRLLQTTQIYVRRLFYN